MIRLKGNVVTLLFYVLLAYVVAQFSWWAYLIYELNTEILQLDLNYHQIDNNTFHLLMKRKLWMVIGEGSIFLTIILSGLFIVRNAYKRELNAARQQQNFMMSITHELRSPLSAIQLSVETMMHGKKSEKQLHELGITALNETRRLDQLIGNILTASRIESGRFIFSKELINLHSFIKGQCSKWQFLAGNSTPIMIKIPEYLELQIDRDALNSILQNLVENAIKYAGGKPITLHAFLQANQIIIHVIDNGPGILRKEKNKVFTKFYRLGNEETRQAQGTGLGLYLVSKLTQLQNGKVWIEDNPEGGSIFALQFPVKS